MKQSHREKIIVAIAAVLFFAAFGTIALMDRGHGVDGEGIGTNDVNVEVGKNDGHISIASMPDDFMVFAAETDAMVDFTVENNDRDNDIDTIEIRIPDSTMINGTSEWYVDTAIDHNWNYTGSGDTATFAAEDDIRGRVFGGSAQYDVVGNIDDALDHFAVNETIPVEISEAVTVTVEFTTPAAAGLKYQNNGMQVQVGDLMTEDTADTFTSLYPDGYPFMIIEDGYGFIKIQVDSTDVDLEVQYGTSTLFSGSRAVSEYEMSSQGIKFTSGGRTYAFLEVPVADDVEVKPIIKGLEGSGTGDVQVSYQQIEVNDVTATGDDLYTVSDENSTSVPIPEAGTSYVDTDGDFIFDVMDPDDDNDGIPDERDPEPLIYGTDWENNDPEISSVIGPTEEVKYGETFELEVLASDPDSDPLSYAWAVSGSTWTEEGSTVTVTEELEPGTYTFTVTVSDDKGGSTSDTIVVEIYEEEEDSPGILIYIIIGAVLLAIVVIVVFFLMRGKEDEEEEEQIPEEISPQEPMGGYEEPEADYEQDTSVGYAATMEEEAYEEESLEPPMPVEEAMAPEPETGTPSMGTVPSMEDEEEGQIPSLPGETDLPEVQDLESLIDEMERTEEEVGDLCPECSSALGPYDTECPSCGAQFEVAMECPNCGSVVEDDVSECPSCGVSFV